ncbi:xylulose kinase-like isoform X2 [Bacillus rossius redtenbacheri]
MWVKALDLVLEKLRLAGADFSSVASLSGTAQQHGSVYWQRGARDVLRCLQPSQFLHQQLAACFSLHCAPVWMDSSTTVQCRALERAVGGGRRMAEITGSTAYERFTASQIAKLYQKRPSIYNNTERISLVSSFACSLLLGDYADIDHSDGSGMNLLDIHSKQWCNTLLDATAPDLVSKLGYPVPSYSVQGTVSKYFVERFDFSPDCKVVSFTGDNPASLVGMRLREGDVAVSLGTSDTVFLPLRAPKTLLEGHVLCSPLEHDAFMALLCFKNGSKTRERIRDKFADGLWTIFDELLENTPRGNFGNMALFYDVREIIPFAMGEYRFNKHDEPLSRFTSHEVEIRALVEGQFVAKRAHAEDMGFHLDSNSRIIATGGASNNKAILQVLSDVFNAPVYVLESANSAVLGAAYQAKYGLVADNMTFQEMTECIPPPQQACCPYADAAQVYSPMVKRYRKIIATIANEK